MPPRKSVMHDLTYVIFLFLLSSFKLLPYLGNICFHLLFHILQAVPFLDYRTQLLFKLRHFLAGLILSHRLGRLMHQYTGAKMVKFTL